MMFNIVTYNCNIPDFLDFIWFVQWYLCKYCAANQRLETYT